MGNGRYCPNAAMISLQITVTLHLTLRVAFADRAVSPNFS